MPAADNDARTEVWLPDGATMRGLRNHNERLVLSAIRAYGPMASAELARRTQLSAQTASVITRALEGEELLVRGDPVRGKVGKPLTPMALNPEGAFSLGLRIGRRSADLVLMDLTGGVRGHLTHAYDYPSPSSLPDFVAGGVTDLAARLPEGRRARIVGLGVGAPYQLWNWLDLVGAPPGEMAAWQGLDLAAELGARTGLPVSLGNDATLACYGEQVFGTGREKRDYAYFYVGTFVGGGMVLDGRLQTGRFGNAGAFGSIVVGEKGAPGNQLIHSASLFVLEAMLRESGRPWPGTHRDEAAWQGFDDLLDVWLDRTSSVRAAAAVSVTAVLDVPTVVIDGGFPASVRTRLAELVGARIRSADTRGIRVPEIASGTLGPLAGALGSAYLPLATSYLLDGASPAAAS